MKEITEIQKQINLILFSIDAEYGVKGFVGYIKTLNDSSLFFEKTSQDRTFLFALAEQGNKEVLKAIFEKWPKLLSTKDENGKTCLSVLKENNVEIEIPKHKAGKKAKELAH